MSASTDVVDALRSSLVDALTSDLSGAGSYSCLWQPYGLQAAWGLLASA